MFWVVSLVEPRQSAQCWEGVPQPSVALAKEVVSITVALSTSVVVSHTVASALGVRAAEVASLSSLDKTTASGIATAGTTSTHAAVPLK